MAAATATWSLMTPFAKDATKLVRARSSHGSRSAAHLFRIMAWKVEAISRASTSSGMPFSILATVTVSALESPSRPIVMSRAIVRDEGVRLSVPSALSARRRRDAHSVATRKQPRNPCCLSCRHSSVPLRCPAAH
jgi:hypothetical protein